MIDTNAEANFALARATSQTNAALLQLHDEFALAKKTFQEQLTQDLDISTAKAQSFLERLVNSMDAAVHTAMNRLASLTTDMETDTARVSEVCFLDATQVLNTYLEFARMSARPTSSRLPSRRMWVRSFSRLLKAAQNLQQFTHNMPTDHGRWR